MYKSYDKEILTIGALLVMGDSDFNPETFQSLGSIKHYMNDRYEIKIYKGMPYREVVRELKNGIA